MLPLQLSVLDLAASANAEWATQASSEISAQLTTLSASDAVGAATPFTWRVLDAKLERSGVAKLAALQDQPLQLDDALLAFARADATASVDAVSLPLWHLFVLVSDAQPSAATSGAAQGSIWMGRHRHAFTVVPASSSTEQRRQRMAQAAAMLHSLAQSQSCAAPPGAVPSAKPDSAELGACAGSRSLSQRLSFTLLNGGGDEVAESDAQPEEWSWNFHRIEKGSRDEILTRDGSGTGSEPKSAVALCFSLISVPCCCAV